MMTRVFQARSSPGPPWTIWVGCADVQTSSPGPPSANGSAAATGGEVVVAGAADQDRIRRAVGKQPFLHHSVRVDEPRVRSAVESVPATSRVDLVVTSTAVEQVVAVPPIVAGPRKEVVLNDLRDPEPVSIPTIRVRPGADAIVSWPRTDLVGAIQPDDDIRPIRTEQNVIVIRSDDGCRLTETGRHRGGARCRPPGCVARTTTPTTIAAMNRPCTAALPCPCRSASNGCALVPRTHGRLPGFGLVPTSRSGAVDLVLGRLGERLDDEQVDVDVRPVG